MLTNGTLDDGPDDKKLLSQCVAHWKEGSTYYFVAMMNSSHVDRQQLESSFRLALQKDDNDDGDDDHDDHHGDG